MRKFIPAILITFFLCFMLFIYEPILMYTTNINDFWFDFNMMIKPMFILFGITFCIGFFIFLIIYLINKKFSKALNAYYILLLIAFIGFFVTYIHGNFLTGFLPSLDGSIIEWDSYKTISVVSIGIWIVIATVLIIAAKKFKLETTIRYATYVSIAIFAMLSVSLTTTLCSNEVFTKKEFFNKEGIQITNDNINTISSNKNFLIFLLDAVDSTDFSKVVMPNDAYKKVFEDFTYYRDTISTYAFTRDAVPYILSGKLNKNEQDFGKYSSDALNNSSLFQNLKNKQYQINIYDDELIWNGKRNFDIKNISTMTTPNIDLKMFIKQELKYVLFKYLPYPLKRFSRIENMDFKLCIDKFRSDNKIMFNEIKEHSILKKEKENYFQYIHIDGAHVPFNYDKDLNYISNNGTYEQKIEASITVTKAYLDRLKKNNVYDNSVIIVMADHGFDKENISILNRFNPILLVKGINEKHELIESDIPVSYMDLQEAYEDLLHDKKSTELFQNIEKNRTRKMLWYEYTKENHMVEYETKGKANDMSKFKETGNVYDR